MKEQAAMKVRVTGRGETKQSALAAALGHVQSAVMKRTGNILLRIEPVQVDVVKAEEICRVEKFLFFFLPREKKTYVVELDISINVAMLDPEKLHFSRR
ncbi:DUF4312 family protein [Martelella alba]|uniref:DUF4312 family protein n=1 Tax=Martelella alba TaxID=2590451 RepID=A0ABY2SP25_9HYPH|nr:DUF4312 family protein [Martelella alba]TKI06891.1 DUF4312 family protein [Martelella alba]